MCVCVRTRVIGQRVEREAITSAEMSTRPDFCALHIFLYRYIVRVLDIFALRVVGAASSFLLPLLNGIVCCGLNNRGFVVWFLAQGKIPFPSKCPRWIWDRLSLLFSGFWGERGVPKR